MRQFLAGMAAEDLLLRKTADMSTAGIDPALDRSSIISVETGKKDSGAIRLGSSYLVRRACRVLFLLVVARVLGPKTFGFYALILSVTEVLAMISGAGFMELMTREVARSPRSAIRLWMNLTSLRMTYLVLLISVSMAALFEAGYTGSNLAIAGVFFLSLFPRVIVELTQGLLRGLQRFGEFLMLEVVQGGALICMGFAILYQGGGLHGVIWTELGATGCAAALALWILPKRSEIGRAHV